MNQWISADSDLYANWFIFYKCLEKQKQSAHMQRELENFTSEKQKRLDMYKGLLEINCNVQKPSLIINKPFPYQLRPRIKNNNTFTRFCNNEFKNNV